MTLPPPPFTISVEGEIVRVHPYSADDTVGDLAHALDLPHGQPLTMSGERLDASDRLTTAGLAVGSELGTAVRIDSDQHGCSDGSIDGSIEFAVITGPSCQPWRALTAGRHSIGRSPNASIRLDDPTVELHHALLDVAIDGSATVTQLTGRVPIRLGPSATAETSFVVGASRIEVRPRRVQAGTEHLVGSVVRADHDPWRRVVRRAPAHSPTLRRELIGVPQPPKHDPSPPAFGLIGAATAAAGAAVMAVVLGQALFALIALIGAVASIVTWVVGLIAARRRRRRARVEYRRQNDEFLAALAASHIDADGTHRGDHPDAIEVIGSDQRCVWRQRFADGPVTVTLGRGIVRSAAPIDADRRAQLQPEQLVAVERCERLVDVGVPMTISPRSTIAVRGDAGAAAALSRSIVGQLAVGFGPADLRLTIVTDRAEGWAWANWLPHGGSDRSSIVVAPDAVFDLDAPTDGISLVITVVPDLLTSRTGAFRRALDASGAACVVLVESERTVPSVCERVLEVGQSGCGRWSDGASLDDDAIALAGLTESSAEQVARRLAPLIDPEDVAGVAALPRSLALSDLGTATDAASIARRWRTNTADVGLAATIGMSHDGTVEVDLVRDGPHALIAGTTGSGKSELLRTLVVSLAANVGPDHLSFVLVDFKGGATFDACSALPHTVGVVTDLDEGLAERALVSLDAEVRRRERRFRRDGVDNIADARRTVEPLPRLVVIVDEFATLAKELPGFLDALVTIAQRGRSLGVHLVLATQRPAGVITDDIRANTNLRLALRVHDRSDALDVVGDERPARFPTGLAGRALMRLGPDDVVVFQTASCTSPTRVEHGRLVVERRGSGDGAADAPPLIETLVASIRQAATTCGVAPPHRPWTDPLPATLSCADIEYESGVVGLIDEPAAQRQLPLRWDRSRGNLFLVGAVGTGTSTAARTIAWAVIQTTSPSDCHLYVLDGHGESAHDGLVSATHCGGVVRTIEPERVDRLLRRLGAAVDRRTDTGERRPEIVLIVDGLGALRTSLTPVERTESAMRFDRILREGPACGIVTCATLDATTAHTVLDGERWEFQAPGRVHLSGSGLMAQIVVDAPEWSPDESSGESDDGPTPIITLPEVVTPDELEARRPRPEPGCEAATSTCGALVVGLGADALEPASLDVADGDHVLIAGAARTGCTTALRQLEYAWRECHPDGVVVHADRNDPIDRCQLDEVTASMAPVLLAIDDADRVVDTGGTLAAIIADRRPGVLVIAAARLEAVRSAYGHWTREVARSRCGLIMTSAGEFDGDLLGATLPRRPMIPSRPGLAWVIDARGHRLVQVAARMRA